MPVAKSYQNYPIQGEPFEENKRLYVYVNTNKGLKKVRWYSDTEYNRMYPTAISHETETGFNAREAFGFGALGYITLYKGNNVQEWAENDRTNIWYNLTFGYYTPSKFETPKVLNGIEPIKLNWADVQEQDNQMKPHDEVSKYVNKLLNDNIISNSTYQGTIGDWIIKEITIYKNVTKTNYYGDKHIHYMHDTDGNTYIWETGTKNFKENTTMQLKMKVKEHKEINDEQCTIVWYCKEI